MRVAVESTLSQTNFVRPSSLKKQGASVSKISSTRREFLTQVLSSRKIYPGLAQRQLEMALRVSVLKRETGWNSLSSLMTLERCPKVSV